MTFGDECRAIYDLLSMNESDRQQSEIVEKAINTAQVTLARIFPIVTEGTIRNIQRVNNLPPDFHVDIMATHSTYGDLKRDDKCKYAGKKLIVTSDLVDTDTENSINLIYGKLPVKMENSTDVIELDDIALDALQALSLYLITKDESYNSMYQAFVNMGMVKSETLADVENQSEKVIDKIYTTNEIDSLYS